MRHAFILAGGSGARLWPLSRKMRPKQLLKLYGDRSLLFETRDRLRNIFEPENIWVVTSAAYVDLVARELPDLPRENLIGEPCGRDTANAVGLAAAVLARRDPDGVMCFFPADHIITPRDEFAESIELGLAAAEQFPQSLVTFGIVPDAPRTEYGYVQRGEPVGEGAYQVAAFKEKPDAELAAKYVESGQFFWNSGMFAWKTSAIATELRLRLPENTRILEQIADRWPQIASTDDFARLYNELPRISIDYGVMERADSVLTVEMDCKWIDLGSWSSIIGTRDADEAGNTCMAPQTLVVDGKNNVIVAESDRLVALMGVDDLIVVQGEDALLICRRDHEEKIKELTELRRKKFGERFE